MRVPSCSDTFQVLLLQLSDSSRGELLLGDSVERARSACPAYLVGDDLPDVYFELPLAGDPFLDVTVLYGKMPSDARLEGGDEDGTNRMIEWFASSCSEIDGVSMGFELDTGKPSFAQAGVHFQPRAHTELVKPFCEAAGEPERAALYLGQASRMPDEWPLSFFGMFRGRAGSPLRVCGYLGATEKRACAGDPAHLSSAFDAIGFTSYDDSMLATVCEVLDVAPGSVDFQFDVLPDGSLGEVFALDVQFEIQQPEFVHASFEDGAGAQVMSLSERMGAADARWRQAVGAAFARALPVKRDDGVAASYAFTLMPQWVKVRWKAGVLQPSKLYYLGHGGLLDRAGSGR